MVSAHANHADFLCPCDVESCSMWFEDTNGVEMHYYFNHCKLTCRLDRCLFSPKTFRTSSDMHKHVKGIHRGKRPPPFVQPEPTPSLGVYSSATQSSKNTRKRKITANDRADKLQNFLERVANKNPDVQAKEYRDDDKQSADKAIDKATDKAIEWSGPPECGPEYVLLQKQQVLIDQLRRENTCLRNQKDDLLAQIDEMRV